MIDRRTSLILVLFLLLLIVFDAFQQKFYIDTYNLTPEPVLVSTLLKAHIVRWGIWLVISVPFGVAAWKRMSLSTSSLHLTDILSVGVLMVPFFLAALMAVSLAAMVALGKPLRVDVFREFFTFFFFQKGITFFLAFSALALWLRSQQQAKKIDAQWLEIKDLRTAYPQRMGLPTGDAQPYINIRIGHQVKPVSIRDISWIQADDYCVKIHTAERSFCLRKSLKFLEKELAPYRFVRVHRGALLNLDFLDQVNFEASTVRLQNQSEIPVSKSGVQLLRKTIRQRSI